MSNIEILLSKSNDIKNLKLEVVNDSNREIDLELEEKIKEKWKDVLKDANQKGLTPWDGRYYRLENINEIRSGEKVLKISDAMSYSILRGAQALNVSEDYPENFHTLQISSITFLKTSDNLVVFGKRENTLNSSKITPIGGGLQPDELKVNSIDDIYKNVEKEILEEVGVDKEHIKSNELIGLIRVKDRMQILFLFSSNIDLIKNEVQTSFENSGTEHDSLDFVHVTELNEYLKDKVEYLQVFNKLYSDHLKSQFIIKHFYSTSFYIGESNSPSDISQIEDLEQTEKVYIQKNNNGEVGKYDPASGEYTYFLSDNLINNWKYGGFQENSIRDWKILSSRNLPNINRDFIEKYVSGYLYTLPIYKFDESSKEIDSRYIGQNINLLIKKLSNYKKTWNIDIWKTRPNDFHIPSFKHYINFLMQNQKNEDSKVINLLNDFKNIMKKHNEMDKGYYIKSTESLFNELQELEQEFEIILSKNKNRTSFTFYILIMCFYIERLLVQIGFIHVHLHAANINLEFISNRLAENELQNVRNTEDIIYDEDLFWSSNLTYKPILRINDFNDSFFAD